MRDVSLETFAAAHSEGALVIDVRSPEEYASGHVPGARLIPSDQITARLGEVPKGEPVYVVCAAGARSSSMAGLLGRLGYDARSVDGGTSAWARSGRPTVQGLE